MTDITPLIPRQPVPQLAVPLVGGGRFDITTEKSEHFVFIVFYRGLHCPICRPYMGDLEAKLPDFAKRGVSVVALSSDAAERAERSKREWKLPNLRLGYGLDLHLARMWGLYVSTSRGVTSTGVEEPALFSEPGPVPSAAGSHALFRQRPNDAVRAATFRRYSWRARLCHRQRLPGPWRSGESTSGCSLRLTAKNFVSCQG